MSSESDRKLVLDAIKLLAGLPEMQTLRGRRALLAFVEDFNYLSSHIEWEGSSHYFCHALVCQVSSRGKLYFASFLIGISKVNQDLIGSEKCTQLIDLARKIDKLEEESWRSIVPFINKIGNSLFFVNEIDDSLLLIRLKIFLGNPKNFRILINTLIGIAVTILVIIVRYTGILECMELSLYDDFLRFRIPEKVDNRILIVGFTQSDKESLKEPDKISHTTLLKVLEKLQKYQPQLIGLTIVRDEMSRNQSREKFEDLQTFLVKHQNQLILPCKLESKEDLKNDPKMKLPTNIKPVNGGFINFYEDYDGVVRRSMISQNMSEICPTEESFSMKIVNKYFHTFLAATEDKNAFVLSNDKLRLNFISDMAQPYQMKKSKEEDLGGNQLMLNYRASGKVAKELSVEDVLKSNFDGKQVKNKIVLVGYLDGSTAKDTPYSKKMDAVEIHAHMISQLINAADNKRSLITLLPIWLEFLCIGGCSLVGSFVFNREITLPNNILKALIYIAGYTLFAYIIFLYGIWLPLIPLWITFSISFLLSAIIEKRNPLKKVPSLTRL